MVAARVSWITNTDSKGAKNIEALMLRDNMFFTGFVWWYSATINMESNIIYMVQGTSKSVTPSTINKSGLFPFSFSVDFAVFWLLKYHPGGHFLSI
jgi:hypothetical protein